MTPRQKEDAVWMAHQIADKKSKDRSTKVGALIMDDAGSIRAVGYNGFPRGINDEIQERHERPEKYKWTIHAEANAIINAARAGTSIEGLTIVCTLFPCMQCAGFIVNSGIREVVIDKDQVIPQTIDWSSEFAKSKILLEEAGVEINYA